MQIIVLISLSLAFCISVKCTSLCDNSACINPKNGRVCGGHGECHCGQCACDASKEATYIGQYCEQCPTCENLCGIFKDCVQCRVHNTGPLDAEQCANCSINPITTTEFQVQEGEELCVAWDENDCIFHFMYKFDDDENTVYVVASNTKDCPQPVDILAIVIGIVINKFTIGLVLLLLLLLLIWKLLTTIQDRREVPNL